MRHLTSMKACLMHGFSLNGVSFWLTDRCTFLTRIDTRFALFPMDVASFIEGSSLYEHHFRGITFALVVMKRTGHRKKSQD
mmetsp:Transcript_28633/g.55365  ORF Transcript_28633/g.55365 Transcript_28633/m.55365 type:complete len:81 (+) Transcript_28633:409-651(+)